MSIRQYRPRGDRRRGISSKQSLVISLLLATTVFMQILYPLVHGGFLRMLTILFVYCGALAMLAHAYLSYGARYFAIYSALTFSFSLIIELIGSKSGWPFGTYSYDSTLGFSIAGVPLVVPFAWLMMAHPILVIARKLSKKWVFLFGALGLVAWDLFIDPQMVATGRWHWTFTGAHVPFESTIPLSNAFGWLLSGMGLMALLHQSVPKERRKNGASTLAIDIYLGWTLFSGVIGNIFFFHTPGVAFIAGFAFAALYLPYIIASRLGRPDYI
jgi:putative membrane protein